MSIYDSKLKFVLWISFLYSAGSLLTGKVLQYVYHLKPCPLCLYQQLLLLIVVMVTILSGVMIGRQKKIPSCLIFLVPLLLIINFILATYHVGVENHIFKLPSQCHGNLGQHQGDVNTLRKMLLETDVVPCDKVKWSFLGISMAGYNALFSLIILGMWIRAWLYRSEDLKEMKK